MHETADKLLVLTEEDANWLFLNFLLTLQLLEQVFIDSQHIWLGEEEDDLDEHVIHQPEGDLLVVLVLDWCNRHPNK